ncbi:hypothetical protein [uncultured Sphingorhabdus sp.]|uniref:hypothetical protein n=1 Tax=uncultured Sphingorhabdus sp. TaxID=1686106 RepID=UPI0026056306|nr:hypothetical protein [uncultured Sphingorhabdus sp.]HMS21309.1 hypothetical protein [Sphingorhabdus sp.]
MTEPAFPPHISAALDRLTVPPLPHGFGDRLAARIAAGDLPVESYPITPPLAPARRRFGSAGWRRSGRIVTVVAAFGIATATAAASGFFGDPVYVPMVSDALAKAKLVELPQKDIPKPKAKPAVVSKDIAPAQPETGPTPSGRQAVRALYQRLRTDPEFRALPRQERLAIARQEIETMLEKGEVTLPELRRALAEHRLLQNPAIRRKIGRELARREMAQRTEAATGIAVEDKAATGDQLQQPRIDPAKAEARREAYRQLPPEQQTRIRELREQMRTAAPAERRAIRRELLAIAQSASATPPEAEKIAPESEGNGDVVR